MSCSKQETKKYKKRPSPPFSASDCKRKVKKGNNGKMFKSTPDKNNTFKWVAVKSLTKKKAATKKNK
jgi:hypothetical protein